MQRIPTLAMDTPLAVVQVTVPADSTSPYVLHLEPPLTVPCRKCGRERPVRPSRRKKTIMDVLNGDQPVMLDIRTGHAVCRPCKVRMVCELPPDALLEGRRVTRGLAEYLLRQMGQRPLRTLAAQVGLSYTVVSQIQAQLLRQQQPVIERASIEHLGLDEIYMLKSKFIVAVDHDRHLLLKVERLASNVEGSAGRGEFSQLLETLPDAQVVTLDMNTEQLAAVKRRWPEAVIVIDQRHLLEILDRDLLKLVTGLILERWQDHDIDRLPRQAVRAFGAAAYPFLHLRSLVKRRRYSLTPADHAAWLIIRSGSSTGVLLYDAYVWREALYDLYAEPLGAEQIERGFETWLTRVGLWQETVAERHPQLTRKPLENICKVMSIHAANIANYARYRVTNADTELMNARLRMFQRAGHRYSPETLRTLVNRSVSASTQPEAQVNQQFKVTRWVDAATLQPHLPVLPVSVLSVPVPPTVPDEVGAQPTPEILKPTRRPRGLPYLNPELGLPEKVWNWLHTKRSRQAHDFTTVNLTLQEAPAASYTAWSLLCAGQVKGRATPPIAMTQLQHWRASVLRRYVREQQSDLNGRERKRQPQLASLDLTELAELAPTLISQLATAWLSLISMPAFSSLSPEDEAAMTLAETWHALRKPGAEWERLRKWRYPQEQSWALWEPWNVAAAQAGGMPPLPDLTVEVGQKIIKNRTLRFGLATEWCEARHIAVGRFLPEPLDEMRLAWNIQTYDLLNVHDMRD